MPPRLVGCKRGDLWVHAGYVGDGKTTLGLNVAYDTVTGYKGHALFVSLEESYDRIQDKFHCIHSRRLADQMGRKPLDYQQVKTSTLALADSNFYCEVVRDLRENPDYGSLHIWQPDRDITADNVRRHLEFVGCGLGLIVIDHSGLLQAKKEAASYQKNLDSVVREAKKLADDTKAVVLLLHNTSRKGHEAALNNNRTYTLSDISPIVGQVADRVTSGILDREVLKITDLKKPSRNREFTLNVDFSCRRIDSSRYELQNPFLGLQHAGIWLRPNPPAGLIKGRLGSV